MPYRKLSDDIEFAGVSALMLAAAEGHIDIVTYLLKHGADVHYKIDNSACGEIVHYPSVLLEMNKDIKKKMHHKNTYTIGEAGHSLFNYMRLNKCSGNTALMYAVAGGDIDIINLLLQRGIDVDVKNDIGATPLIIAATIGDTPVVKFLLERGADINAKSSGKLRPDPLSLQLSMLFRNRVESTPIEDEKLRDYPELGITPVIGASFSGHTELIKFLLQKGASISDNNGSLALQGAILGNHTDTVKMIFNKGITTKSVNLPASVLATAAANGYLGIVKILLDNGMDINGMEDGKAPRLRTPLMAAAEAGHIEVVKLLLDRGADKYISIYYVTAYMHAKSNNHKEIMKLLEDKKVEVESLNVENFQILDPACEGKTDCEGTYLHEERSGDISIVDVQKEKISEMKVTRTGIVTDGITRLILRVKTKQPVKFVLIPPKDMTSDRSSKCDWGTLSEYDRSREHCESIEVSHIDGDYTYALYRSPANFPLKSLKKPVFITIKAVAKTTGEEIEKKIQLFQPPVVFVHGLWSSQRKWKENDEYYLTVPPVKISFSSFNESFERQSLETYSVNYERKNHSTPTFNPLSDSYSIGQLVAETNLALHNNRKNNIAITQVDVVGHSMGGLIARARTVHYDLKYKRMANYQRGDFHKLITIDTPHEGSPHANVLVECKNVPLSPVNTDCYEDFMERCREAIQSNENEMGYSRSNDPYKAMRDSLVKQCPSGAKYHCDPKNRDKLHDFMALRINLSPFEGALKPNQPIGKAVYDLQVGSKAIKQIPETRIPSHAIVGVAPKYSVDEFNLNRLFGLFDIVFKSDGYRVTVDKLFEPQHFTIPLCQ
ncbi:MAG: ankyrin repeat domain-containing protein [Candidatus Electrothrix gigas]